MHYANLICGQLWAVKNFTVSVIQTSSWHGCSVVFKCLQEHTTIVTPIINSVFRRGKRVADYRPVAGRPVRRPDPMADHSRRVFRVRTTLWIIRVTDGTKHKVQSNNSRRLSQKKKERRSGPQRPLFVELSCYFVAYKHFSGKNLYRWRQLWSSSELHYHIH